MLDLGICQSEGSVDVIRGVEGFQCMYSINQRCVRSTYADVVLKT